MTPNLGENAKQQWASLQEIQKRKSNKKKTFVENEKP
jgi:hypothetical protein